MANDEDIVGYLTDGTGAPALSPAERAELDDVRLLLADPTTWAEPPAGLADDVVAAIASESARDRGSASARDGAAGIPVAEPDHDGPPAPPGRGRARRWRPAVLPFLGGVAAATIVLVGAFGLARRDGGGVEVALAGTDLAPAAHATARVTSHESGLRIDLDASGLPRRDGRLFYQAWLKGESGLVPIGTFHTGDHVVLWAGVALADFPTITVTEEEVGDQASSGRRVLVGTVKP